MKRRIKVLLAKLGLDVHNRGLITVAKELRDAGMEVIYVGNSLPEEILSTAIQEDVDLVGVSSLGGAHLSLGTQLIQRAEQEGLRQDMAFMIGGVFAPEDGEELQRLGFDGVFPPGSTRDAIVKTIEQAVAQKRA